MAVMVKSISTRTASGGLLYLWWLVVFQQLLACHVQWCQVKCQQAAMASKHISTVTFGGGWWQSASEQHKHGFGDNDCNSIKNMVNQQSTGRQYGDNGSSGKAASALGKCKGNWRIKSSLLAEMAISNLPWRCTTVSPAQCSKWRQ